MIRLLISTVKTHSKISKLSLVEDWNSKISYGLRAIHEQRGVRSRWLARVDKI